MYVAIAYFTKFGSFLIEEGDIYIVERNFTSIVLIIHSPRIDPVHTINLVTQYASIDMQSCHSSSEQMFCSRCIIYVPEASRSAFSKAEIQLEFTPPDVRCTKFVFVRQM